MNPPEDKVLETERLLLEPLRPDHAQATFRFWSDPALYRFIPGDPPPSLAWLVERYQRLSTRLAPDGSELWLNWMIKARGGDRFLGLVEASVDQEKCATLAYFVFQPFWRRGIAIEACVRVFRCLREECGITMLTADIDTRNTASIRLAQRLGLVYCRETRAVDFFKGTRSDEYRYIWKLGMGE
jgi:Acetyltransferases, including N-acetylases of ribosomal proteins